MSSQNKERQGENFDFCSFLQKIRSFEQIKAVLRIGFDCNDVAMEETLLYKYFFHHHDDK